MSPLPPQVQAQLKDWFFRYVDGFRHADGTLVDMLQLKFDHCVRVSGEALELATEMHWTEGEQRLAEIIGLYHDVGRFYQYQEFKTLFDPASVNHAHCGAELLKEQGVLSVCHPEQQDWIETAVYFHNAREIPEDLIGNRRKFSQVARDADKLDNFFLFIDKLQTGEVKRYPDIIWNLPLEGDPSPDILEPLLEGRLCLYEKARCLADFQLIQVSWVYDLAFPASLKKIKRKNCLDLLESMLPQTDQIHRAVNLARAYVDSQVWI